MAFDPWRDGGLATEQSYADDTGLMDKLGYGAVGAVVSGVHGFYNTFAALGNTFGADIEKADTADWLKQNMGQEASRFYQDNQAVLDTIGLVGTSLIPGSVAVKAAGMARIGKVASTMQWATGLENGFAGKFAAQAAKVAEEGSMTANLWKPKALTALGSVADNAIDGAVAGTTILAMQNQNAAINKEDLSYFQSFSANFNDFVNPFASPLAASMFGAVSALGAFSAVGRVNKQINAIDLARNKDLIYTGTENRYVNAGDGYLNLIRQRDEKLAAAASVATDSTAYRDLTQTSSKIETEARGALLNSLGAKDTQLADMVNGVMIGNKDLAAQSDLLAGLSKIQRVTRSNGPQAIDEISSPLLKVMTKADLDAHVNELSGTTGTSRFGAYAPDGYSATATAPASDYPTILLRSVEGFKKAGCDENEAMLGTFLHEMGHHRTDELVEAGVDMTSGKVFRPNGLNEVSPMMFKSIRENYTYQNDKVFAKIIDSSEKLFNQMVELSRQARPDNWKQFDTLDNMVNTSARMSSWEQNAWSTARRYLYNPRELMADTYKMFNKGGLDSKQFAAVAPDVYKLFKRNGVFFEQYAMNKVGYDSWTGAVTDSANAATSTLKITPQVGDIGGLKLLDKGNRLAWGDGQYTRTVDLNQPWQPLVHTAEESDAIFAGQKMRWGDDRYANLNWNNIADLDNIPELQARLSKMRDWEAQGLTDGNPNLGYVSVKAGDHQFEMNSSELATHIQQSKASLLEQLQQENITRSPADRLAPQEYERLLNIDGKAAIGNTNGDYMTYVSHDPTIPRHAILSYDKRVNLTDTQARSMTAVMKRIDQIDTQTQRIAANVLDNTYGEGKTLLGMAQNPADTVTATRTSSQRGFVKSANGEYGTFMSYAQSIGKWVDKMATKVNDMVDREAGNALYAVVNNTDAKAEINTLIATKLRGADGWATYAKGDDSVADALLQQLGLSSNTEKYLLNPDMMIEVEKAVKRTGADPDLLEKALNDVIAKYENRSAIPIHNNETYDALKWMQDANSKMVGDRVRLRAAAGKSLAWDTDRIYIPPPSADQFTHVAFVRKTVPEGFGKAQEHCVIFGQDSTDLARKIELIKNNVDGAEVLTKDEMIAYKKSLGEYDPNEMLQERRFNTELRRIGVLDSPLPRSDTLELNNFVQYLKRQHIGNVREATGLMFANQISELSHQASLLENVNASQTQGLSRIFRSRDSSNPYQAAIDTLLNRNNGNQWALWKSAAETLDSGFSRVASTVQGMLRKATTNEDYLAINKHLDDLGYTPAYKTAAELMDVNRVVDRRLLSAAVGKANSIVAIGQLSLDFLNTAVNAIGLPVMMLPELANLKSAFDRDEFKALFTTTIPGTNTRMPSNTKAIANAISDYVGSLFGSNKKMEEYMGRGLLGREMQYVKQATQDTVLPAELFSYAEGNAVKRALIDFDNKMGTAVKYMRNVTLSDYSEQAIRFISANVAEQIAKAAGLTDTGQINALMNTFVNRVHGNYTAAQKPFMFQGVIGQAVSLFQTYQFNLMQQAFRNVADGNKKAFAMMMGLQGTIFGMRGLPGFNALNQQIGAMRGNTGSDIISSTYNNTDPKVADWLMYGGASNLLGADIYNRGDINPRTAILIPTRLEDVPAVSMTTKFFQNLAHTAEALGASGFNTNTLLEGIAHNGLNRPLAGLAASKLGYRTTTQGGLLMAQKDEEAWGSTAAAMLGGKTIDEGIVLDTLYRKVAYDAARSKDLQEIGSRYLGAIRAGSEIDHEHLMQDYLKHGGRMENYNKWFLGISKNATEGQLDQMARNHTDPNMQFYKGLIGTDRSVEVHYSPNRYSDAATPPQQQEPDQGMQQIQ